MAVVGCRIYPGMGVGEAAKNAGGCDQFESGAERAHSKTQAFFAAVCTLVAFVCLNALVTLAAG